MVAGETTQDLFNSFPQGSKNYNKNQNQKITICDNTFWATQEQVTTDSRERNIWLQSLRWTTWSLELDSFKSVTCEQRWQEAQRKRLCYRCLGNTHVRQACKPTATCGIDGCTK